MHAHHTTAVDAFTVGRCDECTELLAPDASVCSKCHGTEIGRAPSSGTGSIVSWSFVEISASRTCTDFTSYTIAIVALDDGPWTYAWIEGELTEDPAEPKKRPRVRYDRMIPGERYPLFAQQ